MKKSTFDAVIVGGGAAGLFAAVQASVRGRRILLLEKNSRCGKKLLITGKGRCNVTNACTAEEALKNIPRNGRFLYSAMAAFPPEAAMAFFEQGGCPLKVERGNRVFPVSDRSADVLNVLERALQRGGVERRQTTVTGLSIADGAINGVLASDGPVACSTVLLCTGAVIVLLFLLLFGSIFSGLLFGAPFFICGVICLTAKNRVALWCGWAVYTCADLYLRFATGLSWTTIFMTRLWTPEMNYARLAISWVQLLGMLVMIVCTVRSYRTLKLPATKKEGTWLIAGWLIALVVLPLLMSYGMMPLLLDNLGNYSNTSPYFLLNVVYSYARLALINVLLVRSLAVWRMKREEKKANK